MPFPHPLVSTDQLVQLLGSPSLRVIDATWYLPNAPKDPDTEFLEAHVPGAIRFDISKICDKSHKAPHMLPPSEQFESQVGALGIGNEHDVVVYDKGEYAAARVWWMFRVFGHDRVSVLDGGLPKWMAEGRHVESGPPAPEAVRFISSERRHLVRSLEQMRRVVAEGSEQIVDARPPARFAGELPEIRAGVESGHMPGSRNFFYDETMTPAPRCYLPPEELRRKFLGLGFDLDRPIVATCGSGVSACQIALALHLIGKTDVPVYDGSWAEWGSHKELPKILGRDTV